MKFLKTIIVVLLLTFGLSGCYTQLQYAQESERVEDQESVEEYSWDGEENAYPNEGAYEDQTSGHYQEDYIPIYYKDYETENYWSNCYCNPYSYRSGYLDGYGDGAYYGRSYGPPLVSIGLGFGTFGPRFGFRSWYHTPSWYYSGRFWSNYYYGPASPFRYYGFYDPFFYDSFYFYNPYWFGYGPYYAGYYGYGYGYGGYHGPGYGYYRYGRNYEPDRRRGLRSGSGASRVDTDRRTRSRGSARIDNTARTRSNNTAVRTRSGSTVRNSGTSPTRSRGTVDRTRSRSGSSGTGRVTPTRTRNSGGDGSVGQSRAGSRSSGSRSRGNNSISQDSDNGERISPVGFVNTRGRLVEPRPMREYNSRQHEPERNRLRNRRSSNGFWEKLESLINSGNSSRRSLIRNRSNDNGWPGIQRRSSINHSNKSRPSVRSRSSSGSTRSNPTIKRSRTRSSSSGTRSRSSGSSRSRSRDNN